MQGTAFLPENGTNFEEHNMDDVVIAELERQFASDELLVDALGIALGDIELPEDQVRGLVATSCSTMHAAEED